MKKTQIMVGDWLQLQAGGRYYPFQVKPTDFVSDLVANFAPIPLTWEILEKNGFRRYEMHHTLHVQRISITYYWHECRLEIRPYGGDPWMRLHPLHNTHELQRALHICGLEELADNFKI